MTTRKSPPPGKRAQKRQKPRREGPPLPPGKQPSPPVGPLAERLYAMMVARGVTQSELKRLSGVPQSRISDLIAGRVRYPRVERLRRLALALGQPADALTDGFRLTPVRAHTPDGLVDVVDLAELDPPAAAA